MALVVILSVFNGFSEQLRNVHTSFDPEIMIVPASGKTFPVTPDLITKIETINGVSVVTEVLEDDVYVTYKGNQRIARFKGVTENYTRQNALDSVLIEGNTQLNSWIVDSENSHRDNYQSDSIEVDFAIVGVGLQYELGIATLDKFNSLQLFYPKRDKIMASTNSLTRINVQPGGVFQIERQYDDHYLFIPIKIAELLTNNSGNRSSLEIKTSPDFKLEDVAENLKTSLGSTFSILTSDEQHASLYRAIKIEKLVAYLVFVIVLLIACLNLYIAVSMMVVSKKQDIAILYAMGTPKKTIRQIFFIESALIALLGTCLGLFIGWGIGFLQGNYEIVPLGIDSAIINAFPIDMHLSDFILTGITTLVAAILISIRPILKAASVDVKNQL